MELFCALESITQSKTIIFKKQKCNRKKEKENVKKIYVKKLESF